MNSTKAYEKVKAALENAPHNPLCNVVGYPELECNCWKAEALALLPALKPVEQAPAARHAGKEPVLFPLGKTIQKLISSYCKATGATVTLPSYKEQDAQWRMALHIAEALRDSEHFKIEIKPQIPNAPAAEVVGRMFFRVNDRVERRINGELGGEAKLSDVVRITLEEAALPPTRTESGLAEELAEALREIRNYDGYGDRDEDFAHVQSIAYTVLAELDGRS